tara:strand:+ start:279 stop:521 length:243 start_codon:yes stop_codon:yes gene_type:complete
MARNCVFTVLFAYLATAYLGASVYYMIATRNLGTPFRNSLTPSQLEIKKVAVEKRSRAFYIGLAISVVLLIITKPFHKCL